MVLDTLLHRDPEREVFPLCKANGISQTVWSPLAQGALTGKYNPAPPPPDRPPAARAELRSAERHRPARAAAQAALGRREGARHPSACRSRGRRGAAAGSKIGARAAGSATASGCAKSSRPAAIAAKGSRYESSV